MVGHYVNVLSPEAEDAILTGILKPGAYGSETERCLVGWAADLTTTGDGEASTAGRPEHLRSTDWRSLRTKGAVMAKAPAREIWAYPATPCVEGRFDELCDRFTTERIARVIRQRILTNRLWREMSLAGVSPAAAPESLTV